MDGTVFLARKMFGAPFLAQLLRVINKHLLIDQDFTLSILLAVSYSGLQRP